MFRAIDKEADNQFAMHEQFSLLNSGASCTF